MMQDRNPVFWATFWIVAGGLIASIWVTRIVAGPESDGFIPLWMGVALLVMLIAGPSAMGLGVILLALDALLLHTDIASDIGLGLLGGGAFSMFGAAASCFAVGLTT